jgi:hypothetical protein
MTKLKKKAKQLGSRFKQGIRFRKTQIYHFKEQAVRHNNALLIAF